MLLETWYESLATCTVMRIGVSVSQTTSQYWNQNKVHRTNLESECEHHCSPELQVEDEEYIVDVDDIKITVC